MWAESAFVGTWLCASLNSEPEISEFKVISSMHRGLALSKLLLFSEPQIPYLKGKIPAPEDCLWDFGGLDIPTGHAVDSWKVAVRF